MSWLNLAAASSRETSVVLILINLFAILRKTSRCRKSGSRLATRLIGVPFGIELAGLRLTKGVEACRFFPGGKLLSVRREKLSQSVITLAFVANASGELGFILVSGYRPVFHNKLFSKKSGLFSS